MNLNQRKQEFARRLSEKIQNATLMDDEFMTVFFRSNTKGVEFILRIILDKPDLIVERVKVQAVKNGADETRSIRCDIWAVDNKGTQYDIEFQKENSGASPYRARLNIAILDANTLQAGEDHSLLCDRKSFVIFITQKDYFKKGEPIYKFPRFDPETEINLNDGSTIIYVNGSYKNLDTALGKLVHDLNCPDPEKMSYSDFASAVRAEKLKGEAKNMSIIDEIFDYGIAEGKAEGLAKGLFEGEIRGRVEGRFEGEAKGRAEGRAEGEAKAQTSIAAELIKLGTMAFETIAAVCKMSLPQVQELAKSIGK